MTSNWSMWFTNDSQKRIAMTEEQQTLWMDFIREDKTYCKYYDETVVLLSHKKPTVISTLMWSLERARARFRVDSIAKRAEAYKPKEKVTYKMIKEYIEAKIRLQGTYRIYRRGKAKFGIADV